MYQGWLLRGSMAGNNVEGGKRGYVRMTWGNKHKMDIGCKNSSRPYASTGVTKEFTDSTCTVINSLRWWHFSNITSLWYFHG